MKKEIVIFGAGEWGRIAYYYYKESGTISYYIDNDETLWGTEVNGIKVCSPEILKRHKYTVIIANKRYEEEIKKQILYDYGVREVISFRIDEKMQELYQQDISSLNKEELIIAFSHGLGNQMFQYAFYRNFLKRGKNAKADLSAYIKPDMMPFELSSVFSSIRLEHCNPSIKDRYLRERQGNIYIEEPPRGEEKETYRPELLEKESGYIEGFHCSYKYPEMVRQELLEDFVFPYKSNSKLCELKNILEQKESVGIHVRRGDFLNSQYKREIGNICTDEYYGWAIDYIKAKYPDAFLCFFSDDIEWVRNNMKEENAIYVGRDMFTQYNDWYDMFLMSVCKHNIIPNSTFGWWGAWLNRNPNKIVIAPKRWRNRWEARDWCPPEWILF